MPSRWPPTLGIIGFDQGQKPAVALTVLPPQIPFTPGEAFPFYIGACCYNDGTCDNITEADCIAAEGDFQGIDTRCEDDPNPCVGACCEPTCVADSTPDSCAADGGTWQGFGTTCDPDPCPPMGACCFGTDCSIETESACMDDGGTYQGDGTVCDPNHCGLPCCGFGTFDGSPGTFRTKTETVTVFATSDCGGGYIYSVCSGTVFRVRSVDLSCHIVCQSSGGSITCTACPGHSDCSTDGSGCSLDYFSCSFCNENASISSHHTRTTFHLVETFHGDHCNATVTFDSSVSDECSP